MFPLQPDFLYPRIKKGESQKEKGYGSKAVCCPAERAGQPSSCALWSHRVYHPTVATIASADGLTRCPESSREHPGRDHRDQAAPP